MARLFTIVGVRGGGGGVRKGVWLVKKNIYFELEKRTFTKTERKDRAAAVFFKVVI